MARTETGWRCDHCREPREHEALTPSREYGLLCQSCCDQLKPKRWLHTAEDIAVGDEPRRRLPPLP